MAPTAVAPPAEHGGSSKSLADLLPDAKRETLISENERPAGRRQADHAEVGRKGLALRRVVVLAVHLDSGDEFAPLLSYVDQCDGRGRRRSPAPAAAVDPSYRSGRRWSRSSTCAARCNDDDERLERILALERLAGLWR